MEVLKETASDAEDIPSDFFDDFNKDEFMEGLSVVDQCGWDENGEGGTRRASRISARHLDSVRDLRELISDGKEDCITDGHTERHHGSSRERRKRSRSRNLLDDFIKPGSRRDPNKTNDAIRRDKEVKVKQYLAKKIESSDDLRPPGTELDDYFNEDSSTASAKVRSTSRGRRHQEEPSESRHYQERAEPSHYEERSESRRSDNTRFRPTTHARSPRRQQRTHNFRDRFSDHHRSPVRGLRRSPYRSRRSPRRASPRRASPRRVSPLHHHSRPSPPRRRSPNRYSPRRRPRSRSRSPIKRYQRSSSRGKDSFLYPEKTEYETYKKPDGYVEPHPAGYGYPPAEGYGGYQYPGTPPMPMGPAPMQLTVPALLPQPVPAPVPVPAPAPVLANIPLPSQSPSSVPPLLPKSNSFQEVACDPLAQLVKEGKLSKADYLKLAPNKGKSAKLHGGSAVMDTKTRVEVLNRCQSTLAKLNALQVPNRLVMNVNILSKETKPLAPQYCSPLKRQSAVEFHFTKAGASLHNKQLLDSIMAAVELNVSTRPRRKIPKNMKDAAVQTSKPYCDVCEIRESVRCYETGTAVEAEHFSASVHTQVLEEDLMSSKAVFTPSGGAAAQMSIAHMTPAQLVSQLAARAKTLKQAPDQPMPYQRPPMPRQHYPNYNNYRY